MTARPIARTHPLTGQPLEPLGIVRGRPVWPILGGSEGAPEAPAPQPPATPAAPGQPGTPPATPAPQPPATPAGPTEPDAQDGDRAEDLARRYTPAQLASMALRYRSEAGDRRTELRTTEQTAEQARTEAAEQARAALLEQLKPGLQALGVLPADADTDPAKVAEQLAAKQLEDRGREETQRTLVLENAVLRNAGAAGANPDRLLDSRSFTTTLAGLDPEAPDFGAKVVAAIKAATQKDASLRSTPAVRQMGAPLAGGSGENPRNTAPRTLADAVGTYYQQ